MNCCFVYLFKWTLLGFSFFKPSTFSKSRSRNLKNLEVCQSWQIQMGLHVLLKLWFVIHRVETPWKCVWRFIFIWKSTQNKLVVGKHFLRLLFLTSILLFSSSLYLVINIAFFRKSFCWRHKLKAFCHVLFKVELLAL